MKKMIDILTEIVQDKFELMGYDREYGRVTESDRPDICQFQCNGALSAAKKYRKAPMQIANSVVEELKNIDIFEVVHIVKPGFINFILKDGFIVDYVSKMGNDERLGCTEASNPLTIIVDYGGANVAKPLHVGHLRAAIIGESIKRISGFLGHKVIGDVHLGDWGLQIGMVISELGRRKGDLPYFDENYYGEYPEKAPFTIDELEEIYPAASRLAKSNEEAMEEARKATFELQNGRKGYIALWKHILAVSIKDLKRNYSELNVEFDLWKGESDSQKYIDEMVNYLKDNNFTYESEGATVIDVSKEGDNYTVPPFILFKSDGATLYSTTDLATIWERIKKYDPDQIIYVVDKRQEIHFEQVFRCAVKTNIASEKLKLNFIGFGTMNGKDGKPFKTREGGVMRLQDLIKMIKDNVRTKLKDNKSLSESEAEEISRKVGLAALKYGDLSNQITKDYVFDIDRFSSFEGKTGPYILYTVVRIKSILVKCKEQINKYELRLAKPCSVIERNLMLTLTAFNETVEGAFQDTAPNRICEYIYDLANTFNKFYQDNIIAKEEDLEKQLSWLKLITITKDTLEMGLQLLGLEAPDKM
ncbi:arginine--tRNA ligase [Clostridium sp. YIM B02515]|uniref:Arginine--tRNA ligase n=1 Tax=Clostridium rhizosphaerae TaxID=2803861 RepID=A0ABS1T629_9CLOT|nr:arginine--tRNA ligase [Clostridium rhizosphaerae]MBL4934192.1 arginine--tRNA ligase [Clostridium rhizosphaerae]